MSKIRQDSIQVELGTGQLPRGLYVRLKLSEQFNAKRMIAIHVATQYVKDFDAVLLDAGSTAEMIAEEIFARRKFLSVLTNNMGAYAAYTRAKQIDRENPGAEATNQGNELLITGGRYIDTFESLLGEGAVSSIRFFTPNIIIIEADGLRCEEGIFCHGSEESAMKKLLWEKPTDIRLVATDWTKIGKRDAHTFAPIEMLCVNAKRAVVVTSEPPRHVFDTDRDRVEEFINQIRKMERYNIEVVQVKVPEGSTETNTHD